MDQAIERAKEYKQADGNARGRNGSQGVWELPSPKYKLYAHSGQKAIINRWGDTSMGIGFGESVAVKELWIASQGGRGIWAEAVRVVGYLGDREVGRTEWFDDIDPEPSRFEVGLGGVDRIVIEARPSSSGAGHYAIDDLLLASESGQERLIDFEDARWDSVLTGSGYAGLTWEEGQGSFTPPDPKIVPAPKQILSPLPASNAGASLTSPATSSAGAGTLPLPLTNFGGPILGDPGAGFIPPDTAGAAGLDHFVSAVNTNLSVYEKSTGNRVVNIPLSTFFNTPTIAGDPRIAYDFADDRWVLIATDFGDDLFFAYSETSDPTGAWFMQTIRLTLPGVPNGFIDFPTLGVDSRGVFVSAFLVHIPAFAIFAIDKAPLLAPNQSLGAVTAFRDLPLDFAIHHAVQYTEAGASYMVSVSPANPTGMTLRTVNTPLSNPTLTTQVINGLPAFDFAPNAPALGSTVDINTGDIRLVNACYANGSIWASHAVENAGRAAARWYEVDPVALTLLQTGLVSDPDLHYYYPSIAADANGNVVMGFSGSDATRFPSAYYTGRVATDAPGEMGPPVLFSEGLASYTIVDGAGRNRWGDYSLTTLDPVDGTFWTIQERTNSIPNSWVTWIQQLEAVSCGTITRYCEVQPANSTGLSGVISTTGTTSLSANDFTLVATSVPTSVFGLFFFGETQAALPVGNATLCIGTPFFRLPVVTTSAGGASGTATFDLDLGALPAGAPTLQVGDTLNFSFWHRDSNPAGSNFTDAINVEFCD